MRISIRGMLLVAGMFAATLWALGMPFRTATQFCHAIQTANFEDIDGLLCDDHTFGNSTTKEQLLKSTVTILPQSWEQYFIGECRMRVHIPYGKEMYSMDWDIGLLVKWNHISVVYYSS